MGLQRWLFGGNRDGALSPREEGFVGNFPRLFGRDEPKKEGDNLELLSSASQSNLVVEIPYSADWEAHLGKAVADLGINDRSQVIVTDQAGMEVGANGTSQGKLTEEGFPLRIHYIPQPETPIVRRTSRGSTGSGGKEDEKNSKGGSTQISLDIQFGDVWPGILKVKLDKQGLIAKDGSSTDPLNFVVATDTTGVQVDLKGSCRARLPSPERFPLKLHFRSHHSGPQNFIPKVKDKNDKVEKVADPSALHEHSMQLDLKGMLAEIVDVKLQEVGFYVAEENRGFVLLTDRLGVIITPADGVPARQRFPVKLHVEQCELKAIESQEENQYFWNPFGDMLRDRARARARTASMALDWNGSSRRDTCADQPTRGRSFTAACENIIRLVHGR